MKKFYIMAAFALSCLAGNAQEKLTLSTYNGTNITKYANKTMDVTVYRYFFNGWNTISLPFDLSEDKITEILGTDYRLEKLAGVENDGSGLKLNFQDCKEEGIKANTPYILYYGGASTNKRILAEDVMIEDENASISYTAAQTGETVTFAAANKKTSSKGLYGILAKDNSEASFVNVDNIESGFLATRCYIQLSSGNTTELVINHIKAGDATNINSVVNNSEKVNVYTVSGNLIATDITAEKINSLAKGIYVVKGKKIIVK
ncbi:MAG: hypothetical protein K6E54_01715 [Bacteroidaceae bacterium]|nr:hypothetical protein [Bacteroidaceae bacterium]